MSPGEAPLKILLNKLVSKFSRWNVCKLLNKEDFVRELRIHRRLGSMRLPACTIRKIYQHHGSLMLECVGFHLSTK